MEALKINNKEIQSLKELRDNFDLEQVVFQFLDGTLERWLSDYFYEELADQVETLEHTPELHIKMKLCHIIGIDYVASGFLTEARSCQKFSKQICLWDLVQGIGIIFIIQIVGAI